MFYPIHSLNSGQNTREIALLIRFVHTTKLLTQTLHLVRLNRFLASVLMQKLMVFQKQKRHRRHRSSVKTGIYFLGETQKLDQQCKEMTGREGVKFISLDVRYLH